MIFLMIKANYFKKKDKFKKIKLSITTWINVNQKILRSTINEN